MSWTDWVPPVAARVAKAGPAPVTVSCSKPGGRYARVLRITIKAQMIEHLPAFVAPGQRVRVQLGAGDSAGMVRLVAGKPGDLLLAKSAGKTASIQLLLPGWAPLPADKKVREGVEFDHGDAWLALTLPAWARAGAIAADAKAAVAKVAKGAPFVGLGSTGHAETFAGRRGSGPVPGFGS